MRSADQPHQIALAVSLASCLDLVSAARIPLSTYRLQFNNRFTFRDARAIVDYLHALGISDCYASSYLKAVPGSPHGYDVADPTRLNPDIGTDEDYWDWIEALRSRGMGHVLDLVPNHMGIAKSANPWWLDVLENGPSSRFAHFFDIEWHPVKDELADKVLIPILGDQYGAVLERRSCSSPIGTARSSSATTTTSLPIAPDTFAGDSSAASSTRGWPSMPGAGRRRAAEHPDRQPQPAVAQRARPRGDRDAGAREGNRQAPAGGARRRRARTSRRSSTASVRRLQRRRRPAAQLRRARPAAQRAVVPPRALARRLGGDQLPPVLRRQPARGAADGRSGGLRRGAPLRVRAGRARRGRPACASITSTASTRRRTTCAGCRSAARGAGGATSRSSSSSRRSSAPASSCSPTGRCTARPATSSPPWSTTCSSTGATSARSTTSTGASSASGANGCRSTTSPIAARSR